MWLLYCVIFNYLQCRAAFVWSVSKWKWRSAVLENESSVVMGRDCVNPASRFTECQTASHSTQHFCGSSMSTTCHDTVVSSCNAGVNTSHILIHFMALIKSNKCNVYVETRVLTCLKSGTWGEVVPRSEHCIWRMSSICPRWEISKTLLHMSSRFGFATKAQLIFWHVHISISKYLKCELPTCQRRLHTGKEKYNIILMHTGKGKANIRVLYIMEKGQIKKWIDECCSWINSCHSLVY